MKQLKFQVTLKNGHGEQRIGGYSQKGVFLIAKYMHMTFSMQIHMYTGVTIKIFNSWCLTRAEQGL